MDRKNRRLISIMVWLSIAFGPTSITNWRLAGYRFGCAWECRGASERTERFWGFCTLCVLLMGEAAQRRFTNMASLNGLQMCIYATFITLARQSAGFRVCCVRECSINLSIAWVHIQIDTTPMQTVLLNRPAQVRHMLVVDETKPKRWLQIIRNSLDTISFNWLPFHS